MGQGGHDAVVRRQTLLPQGLGIKVGYLKPVPPGPVIVLHKASNCESPVSRVTFARPVFWKMASGVLAVTVVLLVIALLY